ncbi:MAG: 3-dehydroquinate synthase II family protein [Moorea sp. SIO3I7]|uniref:3-dehydroquinate synthase II family protein n=1 Tax=Moorena sp. SIO3I8 TaxID=2607833 RepID=UPI0013C0A602|nr:3-dehydroquinate synthase II family protein [Moorena sp. SIO3I8]NEN96829.1 3-dehydroquinate synthase II family protein [Moorena sp. SIO3I7]NEO07344.1 3-dehydroquinate synthase II family protein [Moorena sp. SIO3I8]
MKLSWLDLRSFNDVDYKALCGSLNSDINGVVVDSSSPVMDCHDSVSRIAFVDSPEEADGCIEKADIVLFDHSWYSEITTQPETYKSQAEIGFFVHVTDDETLQTACKIARQEKWAVIYFKDPTKIPLEIVLASADNTDGQIITVVKDIEEAEIVLGVLEKGSHGVMLTPNGIIDARELGQLCRKANNLEVSLEELEVTKISHIGMGERACVDTCSNFAKDEGILIGSYSQGMILVSSETHPLPYMPTRPFRVNAGAIHSYLVSSVSQTNYLSELSSGHKVLGVNCDGKAREIVVGRMKIEVRPLLSIDAVSQSGIPVNVIVQDDWHVRVLGPGGKVLNVTELKPGDKLLGHTAPSGRHVGLPVKESCLEK